MKEILAIIGFLSFSISATAAINCAAKYTAPDAVKTTTVSISIESGYALSVIVDGKHIDCKSVTTPINGQGSSLIVCSSDPMTGNRDILVLDASHKSAELTTLFPNDQLTAPLKLSCSSTN